MQPFAGDCGVSWLFILNNLTNAKIEDSMPSDEHTSRDLYFSHVVPILLPSPL